MLDIFVSILVLIGATFILVGSIGMIKLPDFFTRLHAPTKSTTLGVGAILIASTIYFSTITGNLSLHEVLVALFLFITAPISAHLMAKSAIHLEKKSKKDK